MLISWVWTSAIPLLYPQRTPTVRAGLSLCTLAFSRRDPFTDACEPAPVACPGCMGCPGVRGKRQVEILSKINGQAEQAAPSQRETRDAAP